MALLWMDGFEQYNSSPSTTSALEITPESGAPGKYHTQNVTGIHGSIIKTAQTGQQSLYIGGSATQYLSLQIPETSTIVVGFHIRSDTLVNGARFFSLSTSNGAGPTNGIKIEFLNTGALRVVDSSNSSVFFTTSTGLMSAAIWSHIQIKAVFGATGSIELKHDNASVGSVSSVDTRGGIGGAGYTFCTFSGNNSNNTFVDDYYVCDGTGAENNDFLGPVSVYTLWPTAAGSQTNLTPNSGSNWQCVDETVWNDTSYVHGNTDGLVDLFNCTDLPANVSTVHAVSVGNVSKKVDTFGARKVRNKIKSGVSTSNGATATTTFGVYKISYDIFSTKPGGGAWSKADVDAMEIGIETQS